MYYPRPFLESLFFVVGILLSTVGYIEGNNDLMYVGVIVLVLSLLLFYGYILDSDATMIGCSTELQEWLFSVQDNTTNDGYSQTQSEDYFETLIDKSGANELRPYDRPIINYLVSLLLSQQSLLVRNRAFFFTLGIALIGLGIKVLLESSNEFSNSEKMLTMLLIAIGGGMSNIFWRITTYRRGYKVWFIETMLVYLERNKSAHNLKFSPMELLIYCKDKHFEIILKSSSVGLKVMKCRVRNTFKLLRHMFIVCFVLFFISFIYYSLFV